MSIATVLRIAGSLVVVMLIGGVYYSERFPTGQIWLKETYKCLRNQTNAYCTAGHVDISKLQDSATNLLIASLFTTFMLAIMITMQYPALELMRMGFELWLMCELVRAPHVLFSSHSLKAFAVDAGYDFLVIQILTIGTGFQLN